MDPSPRLAQPTKGDVVTALALGVGTGTLLTATMTFVLSVPTSGSLAFYIAAIALAASLPAWLAGLCLLGGPSWWWLHRRGIRSPGAGAAMGALLTGVAATVMLLACQQPFRPGGVVDSPWSLFVGLVAIGAVVGLLTVAFAYRARR
ncbi:hypothetical protein SGCZBJ_22415 [Caulobacter zeae]|uniref:Uncharacterized protein n=1 Tax=Caulobacter zeae TaxID=2055137 RepID=A0A2N5D2C3_9CAUL|nr:hypothetical protein [Caulobacter zeae]PLR20228.1 hypothetical protein SGCZBJ_22415 [Caulobacter zeae]